MRADQARDTGTFVGRTLSDVAEIVHDVHRSASTRLFDRIGPSARSVRLVHDAVATTAYGSTRLGLKFIPALSGRIAALTRPADAPSSFESPTGRWVLSAVSGIYGDTLARDQPSLTPPLAVRTHGGPLRERGDGLGDDLAAATGRVVVFAHGLCESDMSWYYGAEKQWGDPDVTYGSRLRASGGWTPLYLTYNTGRHISDNGRDVAALLGTVLAQWPVEVREIAMVGHSMGGLVLRSATVQAAALDPDGWIRALTHLVFLGTPHLGAPLERHVHTAASRLARLPETEPVARFLRMRSVGVKDLRHGALLEDDWLGHDLDAEHRHDPCAAVPVADGVEVHAVAVTLSKRRDSLVSRTFGDLLVQFSSAGASGHPTRSIPFDGVHHVGGLHHFHLLNHPAIWPAIERWLS